MIYGAVCPVPVPAKRNRRVHFRFGYRYFMRLKTF
jgi:hypothetical protein